MKSFLKFNSPLLVEIPKWVLRSIEKKALSQKKLTIVSAICPDYERINGKFTYKKINEGVPCIASEHIELFKNLLHSLKSFSDNIEVEYNVTLADTEFDLPSVISHLTQGDAKLFISRCQSSCNAIKDLALKSNIPIKDSCRFLKIFPKWFLYYDEAFEHFSFQVTKDSTMQFNLEATAFSRKELYFSMTGYKENSLDYCKKMVIRQWAQYATWGKCAREVFGEGLIMINHSTPNLSKINDVFFRKNSEERIPILQLRTNTLP